MNVSADFERSRGGLYVPKEKRIAAPPPPPYGLGLGIAHAYAALTPAPPPVPGYVFWLTGDWPGNTNHVWLDGSSNHYNFTNALSLDAILTPAAINGLPAYLFAGGTLTNMEISSAPAITAQFTAFVTFRSTNVANYSSPLDANYDAGYSLDYSNSYGSEYWIIGSDYLNGDTADTNVHTMALARNTSGELEAYLDGTLLHTSAGPTGAPSWSSRSVGWFGFNTQTWQGYVAAAIEYPSYLGGTNIASVFSYLTTKWG